MGRRRKEDTSPAGSPRPPKAKAKATAKAKQDPNPKAKAKASSASSPSLAELFANATEDGESRKKKQKIDPKAGPEIAAADPEAAKEKGIQEETDAKKVEENEIAAADPEAAKEKGIQPEETDAKKVEENEVAAADPEAAKEKGIQQEETDAKKVEENEVAAADPEAAKEKGIQQEETDAKKVEENEIAAADPEAAKEKGIQEETDAKKVEENEIAAADPEAAKEKGIQEETDAKKVEENEIAAADPEAAKEKGIIQEETDAKKGEEIEIAAADTEDGTGFKKKTDPQLTMLSNQEIKLLSGFDKGTTTLDITHMLRELDPKCRDKWLDKRLAYSVDEVLSSLSRECYDHIMMYTFEDLVHRRPGAFDTPRGVDWRFEIRDDGGDIFDVKDFCLFLAEGHCLHNVGTPEMAMAVLSTFSADKRDRKTRELLTTLEPYQLDLCKSHSRAHELCDNFCKSVGIDSATFSDVKSPKETIELLTSFFGYLLSQCCQIVSVKHISEIDDLVTCLQAFDRKRGDWQLEARRVLLLISENKDQFDSMVKKASAHKFFEQYKADTLARMDMDPSDWLWGAGEDGDDFEDMVSLAVWLVIEMEGCPVQKKDEKNEEEVKQIATQVAKTADDDLNNDDDLFGSQSAAILSGSGLWFSTVKSYYINFNNKNKNYKL